MKTVEEVKAMLVSNAEAKSDFLKVNVETYAHGEMWQERFYAVLCSVKRDAEDGNTTWDVYNRIKEAISEVI